MTNDNDRAGQALLHIDGVSVRFGGIVALDGVSFDVQRGQICGLIGPNGAGKSTLFNCLSRLYECNSGSIHFDGHPLSTMPRHRMAGIGIGRTFQNLALFRTMTVRENALVGCHSQHHAGFLRNAFRLPGAARIEAQAQERAQTLIDFLGLGSVAERTVADLPFGTQKRVELARALAAQPQLLLLDEPAAGLNHEELESLGALIRDIRDRLQVTVLLVEHHMGLVMGVSDKVVALNFGKKIAEGTPAQVRAHPEVIRAYLGADEEETV
ncbi:ABC transporter ATP-binding protein [Acidovorax sp. Be4]|uniref:ABC transporter ATP-binding protein n=1 Tax=Acidovorax bellezanensis TaxID=2976702 RepID=A0ABT2PKA6_9BURK|nr:ABC transporter ATP-binding protein [Acidovorax sp. Be4]MCT9810915.1 ABC transporter ATP-binding protein [Acidovorax sp. Be4]